jgi:hypothetical protein
MPRNTFTMPDTLLVRKPDGKRPLTRPRHRWDNVDWMNLAMNRNQWQALVNRVMNLQVP